MRLLFIVNLLKKNTSLTKVMYFHFYNQKFKVQFFLLLVYRNSKYPSKIWKVNLEIPKEEVTEIPRLHLKIVPKFPISKFITPKIIRKPEAF